MSRGSIVAVLGGGVYVPRLCELLVRALGVGGGELRLWARRRERLTPIAEHAAHRVGAASAEGAWLVTTPTSLEATLDGADDVILLIRVGGLAARAHDEAFPRRFGLVGDEGLGLGGIANGYRTLPVLTGLAGALRRYCPSAVVYNLIAPLGMTTRLLLDEDVDAVGVCELPLVTLDAICATAGVAASEVTYEYAGINHLGWFSSVYAGTVDVLARAAAMHVVDGPTLETFGAAPLLYYYELFASDAGRRIGIERAPGRAEALSGLSERLVTRYRSAPSEDPPELLERKTPWFDRVLVPMLVARHGGPPHQGFANIQNRCTEGPLLHVLSTEAVVEVPMTMDQTGIVARRSSPPPIEVARFLSAVGTSEELAYAAARSQNRALIEQAVAALPLPIPTGRMNEIVDAIAAPIDLPDDRASPVSGAAFAPLADSQPNGSRLASR